MIDEIIGTARLLLEKDGPGGMAREFRGWALDHPASFRFALGLGGHPARGQTFGKLYEVGHLGLLAESRRALRGTH